MRKAITILVIVALAAVAAIAIVTARNYMVALEQANAEIRKANAALENIEIIPQESSGTLWSLSEGPYEYIGDATLEAFNKIYLPGQFYATGQTQYKGFASICMMGAPRTPVDASAREAWCLTWWYNAETLKWEMGEPYRWGTQAEYMAWRDAEGLAPVLP